jgi:hypothetical protein
LRSLSHPFSGIFCTHACQCILAKIWISAKWNKIQISQGLPNNRNSLLGHQAEPGGTTGPPTRHRIPGRG